jgi:acetyl-CoA carboxylase biotin carboxyl carrier protein
MKSRVLEVTARPVAPVPDVSIVAALAEIAARHGLSRLEVDHGGLRIRIARQRHAAPTAHAIAAPAAAPAAAPIPDEHPGLIKSPLVGTAYLRSSPEPRPFIEIAAVVKAGDKIMLVEAMGIFSEIVAPRAGKVTGISSTTDRLWSSGNPA